MIRMLERTLVLFFIGVGAASLGACANSPIQSGYTPEVDARFGDAVRQARARQTIDPEAGKNTDPVAGIDGEAGRATMNEYYKSFKEPPPTFNILGIGGSSVGN
jgi:hypothetical protein